MQTAGLQKITNLASSHSRYMLQVTGVQTELTYKILSSTMYQDFAV